MNPQQPELRRSATTPLEPDSIESELEARPQPDAKGSAGPVPEANQPGHRPPEEQDQPDLEAFVRRFSGDDDRSDRADGTHEPTGGVLVQAATATRRLAEDTVEALRRRDLGGILRLPFTALARYGRILQSA